MTRFERVDVGSIPTRVANHIPASGSSLFPAKEEQPVRLGSGMLTAMIPSSNWRGHYPAKVEIEVQILLESLITEAMTVTRPGSLVLVRTTDVH